MANATWNPSDKATGITLSGGNLIATNNNGAVSNVRAVDKQVTGKFYWEYTTNTIASVGIAAGYVSLTADINAVFAALAVQKSGAVALDGSSSFLIDGASTTANIGALVNGSVVGIALDAGARKVWLRLGAAGNWNGAAGRDPATGVGGISFTSLGVAFPIYPAVTLVATNDQVTANFGDSAFTGTVPSGFTAGFTAGAVLPVNEVTTQLAVEQWARIVPPQMQATQLALEMWAPATGGSTQMLATQIALEQWAAVVPPPTGSAQALAMILA